jgi:ectoine hydroxylase-related dioxygenase (phytanoyl-CoA dioxygenase family)
MSVSDTQRLAFAEQGILRLTDVFTKADARSMVDRIWGVLGEKYRFQAHDPATWSIRQPTGFQLLTHAAVFNSIAGPALVDALDDLIGESAWHFPQQWGAPLVTFPEHARAWDVPRSQWHLDFPAPSGSNRLPGVRVLAFIDRVAPAGGGTVVVSGSHRLVERLVVTGQAGSGHSAQIRDALAASHPWFRSLWSKAADEQDRVQRFMTDGQRIDGFHVRVEELTGDAGDVVLMHPWTFHAPAPNCGQAPRFMISHSVFRTAKTTA